MNFVLATNRDDRLGGVFAQAYREAGGPAFSDIITFPDRNSMGMSHALLAALKLARPMGTLRTSLARIGWPLPSDRKLGLAERWPNLLVKSGTPTHNWENLKDKERLAEFKSLAPDVLVSVGAPIIFSDSVLAFPSIGAINVHNGLPPRYRGHFGTFWEVYHEEPWAYVCVHEMVPKVDSGEMLGWEKIAMGECRSFFDLLIAKKRIGGRLLAQTLTDIKNTGMVPEASPIPGIDRNESGYFGFPSTRQMWHLNWKAVSEKHAPEAH